ncbi:tRNA-Thr(GGU) m(6)t(6)A37 methyltransferase TsaA [Syntrophus gentianae]|uniref:tRNA-Thr(GGU) m(6)t(6)A37 methyltransferase TsaA n=1 Tax=Syntrophus gentianae TaxID=43775 RepID=A0A1H8B169_9BACT|nr:tRNA (N6-threonylcarbamoyladenosine(37)-N6)-methyltransferase TrmO [Syntrophus gentianae]SEM75989.1 tRNA-Thr(GGU) m(6)t(6)A37 methyltransferase TsaA [Syntrophus gentianae]
MKVVMNSIELRPIGVVCSAEASTAEISILGVRSVIEIFPEYAAALDKIDENSHLWVLSWFHESRRDVLTASPERVNPNVPKYGVFALRTPVRPNPIALTLVRLEGIAGNRLFVDGLDAVDGTPILDIKPYFEQDIVFSPRTPEIVPANRQMRERHMEKEAFAHHRELCTDLWIAVRMGLFVEERWGKLNNDELTVEVTGSPCLADVLQGLTRARLANPPRFFFQPSRERICSLWRKEEEQISLTCLGETDPDRIQSLPDEELFKIEILSSLTSGRRP